MRTYHLLDWITILALGLGLQAGVSREAETLVYADPARLEIVVGQVRALHILLANANNSYGIDLQATFDPGVVEVVDADPKQAGVQMGSGAFLKPDFTVRNLADNQAGTLRYVVTQLKPTAPASGKGMLLSIQFRGKVAGSSSKLTITSAVIADQHGNKQTPKTQGADLVVVRPSSPTLTPTKLTFADLIPAVPTWVVPSLTPVRPKATAQPSPNATPTVHTALAGLDPARNNQAWVPEVGAAAPDRAFIYMGMGVILGMLLVSGLWIWLAAAKRRKERAAKTG
jgi:hypothetical protein